MSVPDLLQQLATWMKRGRALKQWTQVDLAHHADVSYTVIQGIEQGLRTPNMRTVMLVLRALDLELLLTLPEKDKRAAYPEKLWESVVGMNEWPSPPGSLDTGTKEAYLTTHPHMRGFIEHLERYEAVHTHAQKGLKMAAEGPVQPAKPSEVPLRSRTG